MIYNIKPLGFLTLDKCDEYGTDEYYKQQDEIRQFKERFPLIEVRPGGGLSFIMAKLNYNLSACGCCGKELDTSKTGYTLIGYEILTGE